MIAKFLSQLPYSTARTYFLLKDTEKKNGFLVHLAMAYPLIITLLRGIYMMMNSWRPGRDQDGQKISKRAYDTYLNVGLG